MPIHDLGYRNWQGKVQPAATRWWVIAETGIRLTWKNQWLRRMLLVAWLPAISLGFMLFVYEQWALRPMPGRIPMPRFVTRMPHAQPVIQAAIEDPQGARREVWGFFLLSLFRYPQAVLMVLVVGIIAPPLISRDVRSRAFLLYFSRPLERADYVLGKSVIVWTYLASITTLPAMALYVLGVFLSPDLSVVLNTWDLPLRILGASLWLILPTTAIALCFSSLTSESRYAGFSWIAVWVLGWVAYGNLTAMDMPRLMRSNAQTFESRWTIVSLYHGLGQVQAWVFGLQTDFSKVVGPIVLIIVLTGVAMFVLLRRVSSPMRI